MQINNILNVIIITVLRIFNNSVSPPDIFSVETGADVFFVLVLTIAIETDINEIEFPVGERIALLHNVNLYEMRPYVLVLPNLSQQIVRSRDILSH